MQNNGQGLSIAGLVLGTISIVLAWCYMINTVALVLGIIGICCAAQGSNKARIAGNANGITTVGLVISIIGLVIASIGFLSCTLCIIVGP